MCILFEKKNAFLCCFLNKYNSFFLNNSHLSMVEGIAFYALYKSRVMIIPCKADESCLFIGLPDEIYRKAPGIVIQFWSYFCSLFCGITLRKHYIIQATRSVKLKNLDSFFIIKEVLKKLSRKINDLATILNKL